MARARAPRAVRAGLEEAASKLRILTDPNDDRCSIAPEHREAVRLYVDTWITPLVDQAAEWAEGGTS